MRLACVQIRGQDYLIGKRMTKEFEAETKRRGFSRIYMHARVDALGFYEKMGYEAFDDEFEEATIVHRHV